MVHQKIIRYEEEIRNLDREKCAIFSEDGEKIFEKDAVIVDNIEICGFNDNEHEQMRNKILTHNHPSRMLFGDLDITQAVSAQVAELRVVTVKGRFSLKPISGNWPDAEVIFSKFKEVENSWDYIPNREREFQELGNREGLNGYFDRDWYMQHIIWRTISDGLGLKYEKTS